MSCLPRSPPFAHTSHLCSPRSLQVEERSTTLATSCQPSLITGSISLCLPLKTIPVRTSSQNSADTERHQWEWRGGRGHELNWIQDWNAYHPHDWKGHWHLCATSHGWFQAANGLIMKWTPVSSISGVASCLIFYSGKTKLTYGAKKDKTMKVRFSLQRPQF